MLDPRGLYEIDTEVEARLSARGSDARTETPATGPVLINALRGFVDAGSAGTIAVEHLLGLGETTRLVTFDADQLIDYRSKRPTMTFDTNSWVEYEAPSIAIDLAHDAEETPFLVLHGTEPDLQWERFIAAVIDLIDRLDVSMTIGMYGIPMGIPHTRELSVTPHASRDALIANATSWFGRVAVPATVANLLELRLGERGHDSLGFAVHVPHYLAQSSYPPAAMIALTKVEGATGLDLRVDDLDEAAQEAREEVARQIEQSPEIAEVVRGLEEQYDAFTRAAQTQSLLADSAPIPTADELGAEFERFLAQQSQDGSGA